MGGTATVAASNSSAQLSPTAKQQGKQGKQGISIHSSRERSVLGGEWYTGGSQVALLMVVGIVGSERTQ